MADGALARVQRFDSVGQYLGKWGSVGNKEGQFFGRLGLAVDGSGYVYVSEGANGRVQKFTSDGSFVAMWGGFGEGDGEFYAPIGIDVGVGTVFVVDAVGRHAQMFLEDGTFLCKFGEAGQLEGQFDRPADVAVGAGALFVADSRNSRILRFTGTTVTDRVTWGRIKVLFGPPPEASRADHPFRSFSSSSK